MLDANQLIGPNFQDWLRDLKIILNSKHIGYVLDMEPPNPFFEGASKEEHDTLRKWHNDNLQAKCYMLATMCNEL